MFVSPVSFGIFLSLPTCLHSSFPIHSGFSYVDLVEGLHDGRFYALKRILCHDKDDRQEAMHEVEMHLLFDHPNILPLCAHSIVERGSKHEAWLLLPFLKVNV